MKTKRKPTKKQQEAIDQYLVVQGVYERACEDLSKSFKVGYRRLLKENRFQDAKEYCRPWPDSAGKVMAFREILLCEDKFKKDNEDV